MYSLWTLYRGDFWSFLENNSTWFQYKKKFFKFYVHMLHCSDCPNVTGIYFPVLGKTEHATGATSAEIPHPPRCMRVRFPKTVWIGRALKIHRFALTAMPSHCTCVVDHTCVKISTCKYIHACLSRISGSVWNVDLYVWQKIQIECKKTYLHFSPILLFLPQLCKKITRSNTHIKLWSDEILRNGRKFE